MNLEEYDFDRLLGLGYTEKATGELKDACWKGYTAVGTKKKGGREVPNCVPVEKSKSEHSEMTGEELTQGRITPTKSRRPFIFGPSAGSPSFAESVEEVLDFARCQRPDGTHYGTAGTCRKGTQVKDLEERIKRQERFLRTADPSKYSRKEIEIEKKELQRMKSQLAGMKSTMRKTGADREKAASETLKRLAEKGPKSTVQKETYSWGDLIKVSKGNEYKAILHPENQEALRKLNSGDSHTFTDEQNVKWKATRDGDTIRLDSNRGKLEMSPKELD